MPHDPLLLLPSAPVGAQSHVVPQTTPSGSCICEGTRNRILALPASLLGAPSRPGGAAHEPHSPARSSAHPQLPSIRPSAPRTQGPLPLGPEAAQAASSSLAKGVDAVAAFTPSPFLPKPDGKRIHTGPVAGHSWARAGIEEEDPGVTGLQQRAGGLLGKKGERCS